MDEKKRERGRNYTENEKQNLLEIVKKYYCIVENKKTDNITSKTKSEAWNLIAHEFNCVAETGQRNGMQLKLLYEKIKQKAKKDSTEEKVEIYKTGGGSAKRCMDATDEKFFSIIGNTSKEIINPYDSAAPFDKILKENKENTVFNKVMMEESDESEPAEILESACILESVNEPTLEPDDEFMNQPGPSTSAKYKNFQPSPKNKQFFKKKRNINHYNSSYRRKADQKKLEILDIRKRKEEAELKLLLLQIKDKEKELEQKYS